MHRPVRAILGRKRVIWAACQVSSPHITSGPSVKVSKEGIAGLVAVEALFSIRSREAEYREWLAWFEYIESRIEKVPGVTSPLRSNPSPIRSGYSTLYLSAGAMSSVAPRPGTVGTE